MMDAISRVAVFVEVVRQKGFAGAARALGITGSAVSKQVAQLEDQLGVKLLHRTTRQVTLTEEGALYYARARHAVEDLAEAERELQDRRATPTGTLKVNVPMSFGTQYLRAPLAGFAKAYPGVMLDVSFDDRMVDVVGEGFDVVVRVGALRDSSLMAKKLADCPILLVASPTYLHEQGTPTSPAQIGQHQFISRPQNNEWRWKNDKGKSGMVALNATFRATTAEMMLEAALQGLGLALLPIFTVATHVKAGTLVHVLPDYETNPMREISMLYPPGRHLSTKVWLFLDWMSSACRALPW